MYSTHMLKSSKKVRFAYLLNGYLKGVVRERSAFRSQPVKRFVTSKVSLGFGKKTKTKKLYTIILIN